jgi:4-hydroxy-tetrahydrodipicolinate reductase
MTLELLVVGGAGRMGRAILGAAADARDVKVTAIVARRVATEPTLHIRTHDSLESALTGFRGVVIDVSSNQNAVARIDSVAKAGRPLVEGTTGLGEDAAAALRRASALIPVVDAPNFSPGVVILRRMIREGLRARGQEWDLAVFERHHRHKRDAPSGTARLLAEELEGSGNAEIHVNSLRLGEVTGEHHVYFTGADEELELTHRAFHRGVFARGALLAAGFAATAAPGAYDMEDVLGYPHV